MPIHDWTHVDAGVFHHFHQVWTITLCNALNRGVLPEDVFAMVEQHAGGVEPDVLALQTRPRRNPSNGPSRRGTTLNPPQARFVSRSAEAEIYTARANRIAIHRAFGEVIAIIEIVSPGNKSSRHALRAFVEKSVDLLQKGVHLMVVDLFPPSVRDPQGIHKAIWDEFRDEQFELPADKPLTLASYCAKAPVAAYIEPVAVGDLLPSMALFLEGHEHVPVPLEATYMDAWNDCPAPLREAVNPAS